jgi:hypothetical protein
MFFRGLEFARCNPSWKRSRASDSSGVSDKTGCQGHVFPGRLSKNGRAGTAPHIDPTARTLATSGAGPLAFLDAPPRRAITGTTASPDARTLVAARRGSFVAGRDAVATFATESERWRRRISRSMPVWMPCSTSRGHELLSSYPEFPCDNLRTHTVAWRQANGAAEAPFGLSGERAADSRGIPFMRGAEPALEHMRKEEVPAILRWGSANDDWRVASPSVAQEGRSEGRRRIFDVRVMI